MRVFMATAEQLIDKDGSEEYRIDQPPAEPRGEEEPGEKV